jgi:hypothetical protein
VKFVEDGDGRPAQEPSPVIGIVPVKIGGTEGAADGGFAHLARPRNKGHLAVFLEMLLQECGVKPEAFTHRTVLSTIVK